MTSTRSCLSRDYWAHRAFYKHSMNGIAVSNVSETGFVAGVWRLERRACMVLIRVLNIKKVFASVAGLAPTQTH